MRDRFFTILPSDTKAVGESWKTHRFRSKVFSEDSCVGWKISPRGSSTLDVRTLENINALISTQILQTHSLFPAAESLNRRGWRLQHDNATQNMIQQG